MLCLRVEQYLIEKLSTNFENWKEKSRKLKTVFSPQNSKETQTVMIFKLDRNQNFIIDKEIFFWLIVLRKLFFKDQPIKHL